MNKEMLFKHIIRIAAEVCYVTEELIMGTNRSESVVIARSVVVFYCTATGMTVSDILSLIDRKNSYFVNSIKARIERLWNDCYSFHLWIKEAGERIAAVMQETGDDFDYMSHIRHLQKITNKAYYR